MFIEVEKFVEARTNSIAQLLKAIDNDALVSGEVTKGPRTAAQRLPRHMRRRAMAYDIRRFPRTMREFAAAHLISKHAKKCPSRFARRKSANSRTKFGRSTSTKGIWLSTHVWHAKRFRMIQKWGFKLADRSFQRGFRAVLRDSNKNCVIRDRSYYTCVTIQCTDAYSKISQFSQKGCRGQSSRDEEEECHQLYMPGKYPFGYIGPARFQRLSGDKVHIWIHPSSKLQFMKALLEYYNLEKQENTEEDLYKNSEIKVSIDAENICRFHLSGPKCLSKLRDSIRFVNDEKFSSEHNYFLSVSDSVFQSSRDGEVINLLIEDPRTTWDRKTVLKHKKVNKEADNERIRVSKFWNKEFREMAIEKRMADSEFHKQNSSKINGVISTEAKVPIILIIRNEGLKALDGADILIPEPFAKDFWVSLQRRGVRASGLRDEYAAHLESKALYYPLDDVGSEAGRESELAMKKELIEKYLGKPHNRRCKHWSAVSVKYPFEFKWDELSQDWNLSNKPRSEAFVCRDLQKLRIIEEAMKKGSGLEEFQEPGMLIPVKLQFFGRGRPKKYGMVCLPTDDDLISIRKNRNREIIQTPPEASSQDSDIVEAMEIEEITVKKNQGFMSLEAAASEKPINLKLLFEETTKLDDKTTKRKRVNRKKRESKKRRKIEQEKRKEEAEVEEVQKLATKYRFSANREIIGRLVAGEQSVLAGHGVGIGYICANTLSLIASNYHKSKTVVMVRNSTSKYYHPAYVTILKNATKI
ncbi:Ribonucleases P/MRP protein subunit popl-1 [Caenorhabditis elegans]|uniref:Ribonucleases P/MRP protein subunit popl-1 n=1 Tax=Caenorhabditis elegans TaxID=6239 RepID=POPL1_CAEEL|nr:Ribonucleases P/MRP protein subunit popl-1 [Caenorhabditis elegans]Q11188.2 RecName: Full=Ribonucleases P/MRP protein subunit popl-1 [Caenorhabditis elegans]CCD63199.1 Ribonucleases P/MRP protein subunit popl-1 [Caenorhabditis elegans]|eukprot:NP_498408.1 Uncharacterized protein CELE_C05D11.9 [Caenorhabditis elegans]